MMRRPVFGFAVMAIAGLAGCHKSKEAAPTTRPVRASVVERKVINEPVVLTGQIFAQEETSLAFRLGGRIIERAVDVGASVRPGQIVARIDPRPEQDALRSAEAALSASQAQLVQATNTFERQRTLIAQGFTTRAQFDQAQQQLQSTESQRDSAESQLRTARDRLGYADLKSDVAGTVTAKGVEPGEVVNAGQMILKIARRDGRDAVFDVPASLIRTTDRDIVVTISLTDDPKIRATGRVREVAPQANPTTRTFRVKVSLIDPPDAMRLGATVTGSVNLSSDAVLSVPATALTQSDNRPAVWIVDPQTKHVALRPVDVLRYDSANVILTSGVAPGHLVVTAGVQTLYPGQIVRVLGAAQ